MPKPTLVDMTAYNRYPDTDMDKEVFVQAAGYGEKAAGIPQRILICWLNPTPTKQGDGAYQIIELEMQGNYYHYCYPVVEQRSAQVMADHQIWSLGVFTRDQRELLLELAEDVEFKERSLTEGSRVWTAKLLREMRQSGLLSQELVTKIHREVPLPDIEL
ncbi:hypothetical protein BDZ94DRAFT_1305937 [Collybia nuda]|uniref:Uncharacterized protein n=1 Tax=Collybia nuda TaxID=64659 RepID=A0A9P6CHR1_9AGAR|nr:hypothetical protein BDZ94DRAFT_1305937 [Collybia nuda]